MDGYTDAQKHEAAELGNALVSNEAGRDAFLAVAHTALFASSIAFVGDVAPLDKVRCIPLLLCAWLASVAGLLALTASFTVAARYIERRRAAILTTELPSPKLLHVLNLIALWSFPTALVLLFAFASINVVTPMRGRFILPGTTGIQGGVMPGMRLPEVLDSKGIKPPGRLPADESAKTTAPTDGATSTPQTPKPQRK